MTQGFKKDGIKLDFKRDNKFGDKTGKRWKVKDTSKDKIKIFKLLIDYIKKNKRESIFNIRERN